MRTTTADRPAPPIKPTAAPATTAAPAPPNTAEPDLRDLSPQQVVALEQAREDFITSCLADTGETDEERCILIWNCAVNQVGVSVAVDTAQRATLDEALGTCSSAVA